MNSVTMNDDVTGNETLWTLMMSWANTHGDSAFAMYTEPPYTEGSSTTIGWTTAAETTYELRQRLGAVGVAEQQVVLLALPNSPAAILTLIAVAANGAIAHTIDPDLGFLSLTSAIDATHPVAVVATTTNAQAISRAIASSTRNPALFVVEDPSMQRGSSSISGLPETRRTPYDVGPDEIAALLPTSGTSGPSKLVELTHRNYVTAGNRLVRNSAHGVGDRFYACSPFFHTNAQMYCYMPALILGASISIVPGFSASRYFDVARFTGVTVSSMVASPMRMALHRATEEGRAIDPGALRLIQYGQQLSSADWALWDRHLPQVEMRQVYGQTETVSIVLAGAPWEADDRRTIGRPALGIDAVKLVDETGRAVDTGAPGELLVRGEPGRTLMRGYWRNPTATAAALDTDGWLHTGDIMQRERNGRFVFVGRRMHIIRRAGENVSSYELELLMQNCPLIEDAAVRAEVDEALDARIVVHVIPSEGFTESGFASWCRESIGKRGVDSVPWGG
ncbi:class I adenylate-forming enzyme family protein, partial [Rhodococcus wratislaviensis]|uniref:class I adenylate-forming enzyme family protein n=1 Tax=Rhodococcus wratislaviensis TaxID=44752 RepID=UPI000F574E38